MTKLEGSVSPRVGISPRALYFSTISAALGKINLIVNHESPTKSKETFSRIAFLSCTIRSSYDPTPHFIFRELATRSNEISHIATPRTDWLFRRSKTALRLAGFTGFDLLREDITAKTFHFMIKRRIEQFNPNIIFAVLASNMIARLETDIPIVHFSDSTFASMLNRHSSFSNLSRRSIQQGNQMEARALEKARIMLFPSQWAANSAISHYNIDPAKVFVVPSGANIDSPPTVSFDSTKWSNVCRLLFVAGEWRWGGELALAVLLELLRRGVHAELHVVGCSPPGVCPQMYYHGSLHKPSDYQKLTELLSQSTFLIAPSRQEADVIGFAEASGFGTPSLCTRIGGIQNIVQQGVNGFLFAPDATASEYVDKICEVWGDQTTYEALRHSSRQRFLDVLCWTAWGDRVEEIIRSHLYPAGIRCRSIPRKQ